MAMQPPVGAQEEMPLLRTKLYIPPLRREQVPRPRLIERLDAGLRRKLTLISAPAGFGKTTLVSEWIQAMGGVAPPIAIAWLSLDKSDNDPTRFLVYFIAALQTVEANIGKGALSALQSPQPPPTESVLTTLINEIAAIPDRIVLVLDDYHLIEARPIHDALTFLLRHLPPHTGPGGQCQGMHLVIATREEPHLPLARLRARGQLTELRATDLRFTSSEAAAFLNQVMGLDLSGEDIAALERRTEGWIAGLQLAALSMQGRKDIASFIKSFTGSHRFVLDYLIEEVLEQQSESVQTFLLQTAILDRMTGSLCDAVRFGFSKSSTGQDNGRATLEMLEHANLFIVPLDEERRWYRYHHLFADLLRQRLRQTQLEQVPTLHNRASEWYEQNGFVDEAIEHALRAEDFERAAHLIERVAETVWVRSEDTKFRRWLDGLPVELVFSKPQLCIFHAWHLYLNGQMEEAERRLQAAEKALDPSTYRTTETSPIEDGQLPDTDTMKLLGRAAAVRSVLFYSQGDAQGIIQYARQALEYLPENDLSWRSTAIMSLGDAYGFIGDVASAYQARSEALEVSKASGNVYMILFASLNLVFTLRDMGRLQQALDICQQQVELANKSGLSQTGVVGWLYMLWGEVLAEKNELDRALQLVKMGAELIERSKDVIMLSWSCLCLMRVLFSRGDMDNAKEIIQKMNHVALEHDVTPWTSNQMAAWQARIWLTQEKLDSASQWAEKCELDVDGVLTSVHDFDYVVLARILIAQERLDETSRLLQRLLEAAEAGGRTSKMIEILMLQALASQAGGDTTRAMAALERALTLAEPGGFIRIFVDEGPPMARLLYEALTRGISPDYARRLLAAFPVAEAERTDPSKTRAPKSELVEPLSERELEVLQLIAEGLTNPEIASRLFLALNTVKAHTRNIYGKLGVNSRTQAVARARALGILPST
jgi:LuxR family maltose regulon positive regulatory protein